MVIILEKVIMTLMDGIFDYENQMLLGEIGVAGSYLSKVLQSPKLGRKGMSDPKECGKRAGLGGDEKRGLVDRRLVVGKALRGYLYR